MVNISFCQHFLTFSLLAVSQIFATLNNCTAFMTKIWTGQFVNLFDIYSCSRLCWKSTAFLQTINNMKHLLSVLYWVLVVSQWQASFGIYQFVYRHLYFLELKLQSLKIRLAASLSAYLHQHHNVSIQSHAIEQHCAKLIFNDVLRWTKVTFSVLIFLSCLYMKHS